MLLVVADASSLILLTKCSLFRPYAERVTLIAPHEVVEEAASPRLWSAHPDAELIAGFQDEGLLRVERVRSRRDLPLSLGPGESEAILLFLERDADLFLSDDGRALRSCRLLGIPFTTTPRVAVDLRRRREISLSRGRKALEKLAVEGRYSRDVIAAALVAMQETPDEEADDDPFA